MKKLFIFLLLVLVLVGCAAEEPVQTSSPDGKLCAYPESDNDYSWDFNSCVSVDSIVYHVSVILVDTGKNHEETNAAGLGSGFTLGGVGNYASSFRVWQEGKGLLPVQITSISPGVEGIDIGDTIILKTADLKAMAIPENASASFICNLDTEVLSPVSNRQTLTTDRLTYELDDCRMVSPEYSE